MSDEAQDPVGAIDAVGRIAAELVHLSSDLRCTERVLFPIVIRAGVALPGTVEFGELQRFDTLMQSLDGLAQILADVSPHLRDDPDEDMTPIITRTRLSKLAARLLRRAHAEHISDPVFADSSGR